VVRVFRDKDWTIINDLHPFAKDGSKHQVKIFGDKFRDGNMGTVISPLLIYIFISPAIRSVDGASRQVTSKQEKTSLTPSEH
jgi:hypothetical protein